MVNTKLICYQLGGVPVVSGEHVELLHTLPAQRGDGCCSFGPDLVGYGKDASQPVINGGEDNGVADPFALFRISAQFFGQGDADAGQEPAGANGYPVPVDVAADTATLDDFDVLRGF